MKLMTPEAHVLLTSVCKRYNGTVGQTHTKTVCVSPAMGDHLEQMIREAKNR